jgi:hypothetical protein
VKFTNIPMCYGLLHNAAKNKTRRLYSLSLAEPAPSPRERCRTNPDLITQHTGTSKCAVPYRITMSTLTTLFPYIIFLRKPSTVATRSKAWTVFARSNTGIVGTNPTRVMDVCVCLFCVCVVLCVGSGLAMGWSPVQGVLLTVYRIKKLKKRPRSQGL